MISIGGRWWRFPGAQTEMYSLEFEWGNDGKLRLHESTAMDADDVERHRDN